MSWHAVDAVGDAFSAARKFLLPFDAGRWLRLAVIALFLGGVGGGGNAGTSTSAGGSDEPFVDTPGGPAFDLPVDLPAEAFELGIALAVVFVGLGLVFGLLSSVMRLVLLDALRTDEVRVRGPFRRRFGQGARLFGFLLALGVLVSLPLIAAGGLFAFSGVGGAWNVGGAVGVGVAALLAFATVLLAVPYALVVGFTNTFVAPVMVVTDCGVRAGWRRFWSVLKRNWGQFLVYLLVRFVLSVVVGVAVGVVAAIVGALVFGIAVGIGFLASVPFGGVAAALSTTLGLVGAVVLAGVSAAAFWVLMLPIRIPVLTYFTAYEVLVLRRAAPEFDLLPWYAGGSGGDGAGGRDRGRGTHAERGATDEGGASDAADDPDRRAASG